MTSRKFGTFWPPPSSVTLKRQFYIFILSITILPGTPSPSYVTSFMNAPWVIWITNNILGRFQLEKWHLSNFFTKLFVYVFRRWQQWFKMLLAMLLQWQKASKTLSTFRCPSCHGWQLLFSLGSPLCYTSSLSGELFGVWMWMWTSYKYL